VSYTCFDVSLQDKIAHIVLKRPEAYNTMIPEFWNHYSIFFLHVGIRQKAISRRSNF